MSGVNNLSRDAGEQTRSGTNKVRHTIDSYRDFFRSEHAFGGKFNFLLLSLEIWGIHIGHPLHTQ